VRRRRLVSLLGAASLAPAVARAQDFPSKPITLVVPFAAGGSIDVLARLTAEGAGRQLGQNVVIENRGGAAGLIGAAAVARAEPDGHTLLMASAAQVTIPPWINRSLTFDPPRDLAPVAHLADTPMVLVVPAASEARTVAEFVSGTKAKPGVFNYGSTGIGTISHLTMETLKLAAGIDIVHVPYRGAAPAMNDLQAGQVQAMFTSTASAQSLIASSKLRALAVTSKQRSAMLPDVPTMAEAAYAGAEVIVWSGIMAPAGTPRRIVALLERAFIEPLGDKVVQERLARLGADPVGHGARQFAEVIERDLALWQRVAQATGIKVE
jgi:tripartite-type tricarboxylate transporter receptor subunit TctC